MRKYLSVLLAASVSLGAGSVTAGNEQDVADLKERATMARDVKPTYLAVVFMAFQAVLIQYRLNISQYIEDLRYVGDRFGIDGAGTHDAGVFVAILGGGRFGSLFVAADTGGALAWHDGRERVHAFDAMPFLVHRQE